jgi:tetratricopeptide (TPR) repeat protein
LLLGLAPFLSLGQVTDGPPVRPEFFAKPPGISAPAPQVHPVASNVVEKAHSNALSASLTEANMIFASTNLMHSDDEQAQAKNREMRINDWEKMLATGRRQRAAKLFAEATPNFTAVLTGDAPDELQRAAMLELALTSQEENNLMRAIQILSQYLSRWPQDPNAPEIFLRQGLLYRQLGIHNMAMTKFYATMTTVLTLKNDHFDHYRKLVLQAQTEIAETLMQQNKYAEAGAAFARLLKDESPALNRVRVQYRYIHSLVIQDRYPEAVGQAQDYLARYTNANDRAEVYFLLASGLKKLGRNNEARQEVLHLLQSQQSLAWEHPETLAYWQQRTGNEIANQLYQEGDFMRALDIYQSLLLLNPAPAWQWPVRYQIGLIYERLEQPAKAAESYTAIFAKEKELGTNQPPSLKALIDMARWRQGFLRWQIKSEMAQLDLKTSRLPEVAPVPPNVKTNTP